MLTTVRRITRFVVQRRGYVSNDLPSNVPDNGKHHPGTSSSFSIDHRGHEVWSASITSLQQRTIQLRFAHVPESMVHALSAIREVERNFGRVRDYRFARVRDLSRFLRTTLPERQDANLPSKHQALCWAAFESPESLDLVPSSGMTLKVPVPPTQEEPEGGPSLNDLIGFLEPRERDKLDRTMSLAGGADEVTFNGTVRTILVEVRRAGVS